MFLKNFASHTHAFYSYFSMLGGFYAKTRLFFQNSNFSGISTDRGCFSINRNWFKKILVSLCLFRSIKADFRSIENRESGFLKTEFDLFKFMFQKLFKLFSLSLWFGQGSSSIFYRFPPVFLQGFPLSKPVSPLYPSFCINFHVFMHLFMHFVGFLDLFFFVFLFIHAKYSKIDHWVLFL